MRDTRYHKQEDTPPASSLIRRAYATYYRTGHYSERYPGPNPTIWRKIIRHTDRHTHLIDYGCGTGRYLLALQSFVGPAAGFDISAEALRQLRTRAKAQGWHDLAVLGPAPKALDQYLATKGPSDLVLCLFGVIAHIIDPAARQQALKQMRRAVKPGSGRLLISVPNIARRFRAEQSGARDGIVSYNREIAGNTVVFAYQLYDASRLRRELEEAGFTIEALRPESVFPENWLLTKPWARWLDALLTPFCPTRWGYGLFAEAS